MKRKSKIPDAATLLGGLKQDYGFRRHSIRVDGSNLDPKIQSPYFSEIELQECASPTQLGDVVLQVSMKTWCDPALACELLEALEGACVLVLGNGAHGVFCPGAQPRRLNWENGTRPAEDQRRGMLEWHRRWGFCH